MSDAQRSFGWEDCKQSGDLEDPVMSQLHNCHDHIVAYHASYHHIV